MSEKPGRQGGLDEERANAKTRMLTADGALAAVLCCLCPRYPTTKSVRSLVGEKQSRRVNGHNHNEPITANYLM